MANEKQLAILKQGVGVWNQWRHENPDVEIDLFNAYLIDAYLRGADLNGANLITAKLSGADLSGANLSGATLSGANLSGANLITAKLITANLSGADLSGASLITANLAGANLIDANLNDAVLNRANLEGADLEGANLREANLIDANLYASQALFTDFSRATLTGACIYDWQMGSSTKFEDVQCDHIFRAYDRNRREFTGRLPVDPSSTLAPGEFEQWIQVRKGALDTIDITFQDGIDWQSFFQSLQVTRHQHPDANVVMQSVEERDGIFVARLRVETEVAGEALEQLKAGIETEIKATYEGQLAAARDENLLLRGENRALDKVVEKLAMTSKYTFHGNVGNVADTNYGSMTAHINQNGAEIRQLINSLRTTAQSFPGEQKDEALMNLDEVEESVSEPEKQNPKRIGLKLKRLIAIATTLMAIAGGAASFSGHLNEFTENVFELGEKVGLTREMIQSDEGNR